MDNGSCTLLRPLPIPPPPPVLLLLAEGALLMLFLEDPNFQPRRHDLGEYEAFPALPFPPAAVAPSPEPPPAAPLRSNASARAAIDAAEIGPP
eukprot:COSAG05_NODE_1802_length_4058_cov_6.537004_2_plen_93_part_00